MLGDYLFGYVGALAGILGFVAARLLVRFRRDREARSRVAADSLARAVLNGGTHAERHGYGTGTGSHVHGDHDTGPGSIVRRETGRRAIRRNYYRFGPPAAGRRSSAHIADAAAIA